MYCRSLEQKKESKHDAIQGLYQIKLDVHLGHSGDIPCTPCHACSEAYMSAQSHSLRKFADVRV